MFDDAFIDAALDEAVAADADLAEIERAWQAENFPKKLQADMAGLVLAGLGSFIEEVLHAGH